MELGQPLAVAIASLAEDPREGLRRAAELGFRWVQISGTQRGTRPREMDRSAVRDLAATLRRHELGLAGIDLWIPPEHFRDPARVDRAMEALVAAVRVAGQLGHHPVSVTLPASNHSAAEGPAEDHDDDALGGERGTETLASALREMARLSAHEAVPIADHAVPATATEGIGIGIDPPAYLAAGRSPAKAATHAGDRLASARLVDLMSDGSRGPIGGEGGRLDVTAYRAALSVAGLSRPVVVDPKGWGHVAAGLQRTARRWGEW